MKRALLVIDVQNEYLTGLLPVTHPHGHFDNILRVMDAAAGSGVPIEVVQHTFTRPEMPFFRRGTPGLGELQSPRRTEARGAVSEKKKRRSG